jgi:hypothetical protein
MIDRARNAVIPESITCEPDDWSFHYPPIMVLLGFDLWRMSDFTRLPTPDEVAQVDRRWIEDLSVCYALYQHKLDWYRRNVQSNA